MSLSMTVPDGAFVLALLFMGNILKSGPFEDIQQSLKYGNSLIVVALSHHDESNLGIHSKFLAGLCLKKKNCQQKD